MEQVVQNLNNIAKTKVTSSARPIEGPEVGQSSFASVLKTKQSDAVLEQIKDRLGMNKAEEIKALSADDIQIKVANPEKGEAVQSPSDLLEYSLKKVDQSVKDMKFSMDYIKTKSHIRPVDLLRVQEKLAEGTLQVSLAAKLVEFGARGINEFKQMQV